MAYSTRTVPIIIASVVAILLVAGAYVLSGPIPLIDRVTAESSEELLRAYAVKDTDSDGLTDWQEELYGTDPANPTSFRADLLDGEAARQELLTPKSLVREQEDLTEDLPGTDPAADSLTEAFSKKFLAQYLSTRGTVPPTEAELIAFVEDAMTDLVREAAAHPQYSVQDAQVTANDVQEYRTYAANAAAALSGNAVSADKEDLAYFAAAVNGGDTASLKKLEKLSGAYTTIAAALFAVEVPRDMRTSHVAAVNAFDGLGTATAHLAELEDDPILAMLGIAEYQRYRTDLINAFVLLNKGFVASGITISETEPGYAYYAMSREANKAVVAPQP